MRILHLAAALDLAGGVERYLRVLAAAQFGRGNAVLVVGGTGRPDSWPAGAVEVRLVPGMERPGGPAGVRGEVLRLAAEFRPDVVHIHEIVNFRLARELAGRWPTLKHAHVDFACAADGRRYFRGSRQACSRRLGPLCLWHYYAGPCGPAASPLAAIAGYRRAREALRTWAGMRAVLVNSEHLRGSCLRAGLPEALVEVLHYYTADAPASPREARLDGRPEVLFAGRVVAGKGLEDLVAAMARLKGGAGLCVAGDGFARGAAEKQAARLGLTERVRFAGWQADLDAFYRRASLLVVPSLWPEPFGIVGLEAMARALPVVAYRSGGIPEWLEDRVTGLLVEPGDVDALAAAIDRLLGDPALARAMGRAGQERQRRLFAAGPHLARLEQIYTRVAGWSG